MKPLDEIIEDFNSQRDVFNQFVSRGDDNKETLLEFLNRFINIKADLRPYHTEFAKKWSMFDDKSATAIKFRLAVAMVKGEYKSENPMFEKAPTITNAEKYASGSPEYKEFINKRYFYKESLTNISDLREDASEFINQIKMRLK